jgi:hypothetical protein
MILMTPDLIVIPNTPPLTDRAATDVSSALSGSEMFSECNLRYIISS